MSSSSAEEYAALSLAICAIIIQIISYYGLEYCRRNKWYIHNTHIRTPMSILIIYGVCQMGVIIYYIYRIVHTPPREENVPILYLYRLISVYASLSITTSIASCIFISFQNSSVNICNVLHACMTISLTVWFTDKLAIVIAVLSIVIAYMHAPFVYIK